MTPDQILPGGSISSAVEQTTAELRKNPMAIRERTFLFELLCCSGEWDRAAKQLDVLAQAGPEQDAAVSRYRKVLEGEVRRRAVFQEGKLPGMPPNCPAWMSLHLEALTLLHSGSADQARAALEQAAEQVADLDAEVDGTPAEGLRDADDRFGPILELFTGAEYSWIPFSMIQSLTVNEPKNFRDLLYLPATLVLHIGPLGEVFLPVRYPASEQDGDEQVRLGKTTTWSNTDAGLSIGSGQRFFAAGETDWPILQVRSVIFPAPADHV